MTSKFFPRLLFPSSQAQKELMQSVYEEIGLDPHEVNYVEAHGTGTVVGDPEECNALDAVFCSGGRKQPLLIGSVKTNLGHCEAAAAICSIAKIVLAFNNNLIPPHLHFERPNPSIPALVEGRLKVITEPTPLDGPLIAVSAYGFGGANAHVLLRANEKQKLNLGTPDDSLPRLVLWSSRTRDSCSLLFNDLTKRPLNAEHVALINSIQSNSNPSLDAYRSYGVFEKDKNAKLMRSGTKQNLSFNRPVILVLGRINSCHKTFYQIPSFKVAMAELHKVLEPSGINLKQIINTSEASIDETMIQIRQTALQIAVIETLFELGLRLRNVFGDASSAAGVAYADGSLSAAESIMYNVAGKKNKPSILTNINRINPSAWQGIIPKNGIVIEVGQKLITEKLPNVSYIHLPLATTKDAITHFFAGIGK